MNRVFRLLGVVLAFIWLHGAVSDVGTLFGREPREIGAFEEPYYTCNDANLYLRGTARMRRNDMYVESGLRCLRSRPVVAVHQRRWQLECRAVLHLRHAGVLCRGRDQCAADWGTWHEEGCWCESCNPSDEVVGSYPLETPLGCVDCCYREYSVTTEELHLQYCQDGRYRGQYTVGTGYLEDRRDYYCAIESWAWCSEDHPNPFYDCW